MRRLCFLLIMLAVSGTCAAAQTALQQEQKGLSSLEKLPLSFAANLGQADSRVKFLARGMGLSLFLTEDEAVVVLKKPAKQGGIKRTHGRRSELDRSESVPGDTVRMRLVGANSTAQAVGAAELPGKANYFIGNDPSKWRTNVPTYAKVKFESVYAGIDLVYQRRAMVVVAYGKVNGVLRHQVIPSSDFFSQSRGFLINQRLLESHSVG